jgi:proton-dependent oligopeptide transporter, POT family
MLLPVRTLFAHQWLTMPQYILRAYPEGIADRMEWLVNWINPLIIFIGVPLATALTRHINVYRMMVIGSFVSATPTFLLCFGPTQNRLVLVRPLPRVRLRTARDNSVPSARQ